MRRFTRPCPRCGQAVTRGPGYSHPACPGPRLPPPGPGAATQIPPPSVDPGREGRIAKYQARAQARLPLFGG